MDHISTNKKPPIQVVKQSYRITADVVNSVTKSISEYKKRCARNGVCPNDGKPCKYYKNCILSRCEACLLYTPRKGEGSSSTSCITCMFYPGEDKLCKDFSCMTAYKGR